MARRFNFTGRQKILMDDISISLNDDDNLSFKANLSLASYQFAPDARIHLEAYRSRSALWKRFDFGEIRLNEIPDNLSLKEFGHLEGIKLRVKITSEGKNKGRLLGEADGITPKLPNEQKQPSTPLIDVDRGPLGGEPWRIRFPESIAGMPTLVINERINDWNSRARDPVFRAVVLPSVMRQILTKILIIDSNVGDEDDLEDWRQRWLRFAKSLPNVPDHPALLNESEDIESRTDLTDWIDDSVSAFGKSSKLLDNLVSKWNMEEWS